MIGFLPGSEHIMNVGQGGFFKNGDFYHFALGHFGDLVVIIHDFCEGFFHKTLRLGEGEKIIIWEGLAEFKTAALPELSWRLNFNDLPPTRKKLTVNWVC